MHLPDTLDGWRDALDQALRRAVVDARHPFRWPTLVVPGPDACTVVLRGASDGVLEAHADRRTGKVRTLGDDGRAVWHFLHRRARVQVRARGATRVHLDDAEADAVWQTLSPAARSAYGGVAPGTVLDGPHDPPAEADRGAFALIRTRIDHLDVLHLGREGHRRAIWTREDGALVGRWVAP